LLRVIGRPAADSPDIPRAGLTSDLIGREREFLALVSAWEKARDRGAKHVHVAGAAGIGKSRSASWLYSWWAVDSG
jgi:transcriptional regulator with AAA-type ATPase domain